MTSGITRLSVYPLFKTYLVHAQNVQILRVLPDYFVDPDRIGFRDAILFEEPRRLQSEFPGDLMGTVRFAR
jgi:hypothetical protein